jgi:membrane protein YqaA with SNARE-associated domain
MTETFGLFLSGLLSATLLPGSSEALLIALLLQETAHPMMLVAAVTAGNVLGSVINWYMGKYLMHFQSRKWFPINTQQIDKAQYWFSKYGIYSLLFAWLPVVGDPLTLVAGALKVRLPVFFGFVLVGKLARYIIIALGTLALT